MAARNSLPPPMPSSGLRYSTEFPYLEDLFSTVALHQGTAALESVVLSELQEMLAEFLSRALENDQAERVEKLLSFQEQLEQMEIPIGVDPASVTIIPYSRINSLLPSPPSPPRAAPAPSSYPSGPVECPICLETNSPEEMRCLLSCGCHHFCRQCMEQHLATLINDAEVSKITCPAPGCQAVPEEYEINALVSEETYEKYLQFMVLAIVNEDKDAKWCPNLQCGEPICWDPKESTVTCPACKTQFCFDCSRLLHPGLSCDGNKLPDFEEKFQEWLRAKNALVKQCPGCAAHLEKNDGCNHMTCRCTCQWCWLCNEKMESSHFTSGRCEGLQFAAFNTIEEALADKEAKKKERERQQALQAAQEAEAAAQAVRRAVLTCSHCSVVFPSETALSAHQVTCSPSESSSSSSSSSPASSAPSVFVCRRCSASGFASALAHFLHESTCNATIHPSRQVRKCRRFIR